MPARSTVLSGRLIDKLSFNEWIRLDDLIKYGIAFVPPGKALRQYDRNYADAQRKAAKVGYKVYQERNRPKPLSEREKIASGARSIVYGAIAHLDHGCSSGCAAADPYV